MTPVLGLVLVACIVNPAAGLRRKSQRISYSADQTGTWKRHFEQYMSKLIVTDSPEGLNHKCKPYIRSPPQGTASRGLVILNHGFSACPGFWYLLTPELVAKGWTVMAPLMPGHGRNPKIEHNGSVAGSDTYLITDWSSELETTAEGYKEYSDELIEIVAEYKAENGNKEAVLSGCSHGGAVASYMMMNAEAGTFDRVMLMNPFLAPPTGLGADFGLSLLRDLIPTLLPALSLLPDFGPIHGDGVSWGDDCEHKRWPSDWRQGGHGGLCQFSLEAFRGVLQFGNMVEAEARDRAAGDGVFTGGVLDRVEGFGKYLVGSAWDLLTRTKNPPPTDIKVQLITTTNDGSISNERVHFAAAALGEAVKPGNLGYCVMDEEMSHVYISPCDKPSTVDHWWLDQSRVMGSKNTIDMLVDFCSEGITVPMMSGKTVTDDAAIRGDPRCDLVKRQPFAQQVNHPMWHE